jgi:hypothetical protein
MKIKKNNVIVTLTESDITSIKKYLLKEEKISFKFCFKTYPEWLRSDSTDAGYAGTKASSDNTLWKKIKTGVTFSVTNCEGLKNDEISTGILSKITDFTLREKAVEKTVEFCRSHINGVIEDIKSGDVKKRKIHIKSDFTPPNDESIDSWVTKHDFTTEIADLVQINKCLYNTQF